MSRDLDHLSAAELIAAARGEPVSAPAAGHLGDCESCTAEVRQWRAVGDGIQVLVARSEPSRDILGQVFEAVGARTGWRGHGRWWLTAAAAVVLIGGGYGVGMILTSAGGGRAPARASAALTATGCSGLEAVGGTLTSVSGSVLTIGTPGGSPVTVTTSADTTVLREVAGSLSDVTDGTHVTVFGTNSGATIRARSVALANGAAPGAVKPPAGPAGRGGLPLQLGIASGTVADAGSSGFTVDEPDGSRVRVATSSSTRVLTLVASRVGQLKTGQLTSAVGNPGPDGRLAATMVEQDSVTPPPPPRPSSPSLPRLPRVPRPQGMPGIGHGPGPAVPSPPPRPALPRPGSLFPDLGCAQDTIATTYLMSLTA